MAHAKPKLISTLFLLFLAISLNTHAADEPLSPEAQRQIIENYMYVRGQRLPASVAASIRGNDTMPLKCGTSAVMDFALNKSKLDRRLMAALGVDTTTRPAGLDKTLISNSGHFKIHYTTTGPDSAYQSHVVDGNGVPIYIDSIAAVADRAWRVTIDSMGYPAPPSDSFYDSNGPQFDIYVHLLPQFDFGLTYPDSTQIDGPGSIRATSFMELDHDYQQIPGYENRPLDAVRVTVAHEFFHSVQFGINFTESETVIQGGQVVLIKRYWMEMSAVWMEEQQYTAINDYYNYLPFFFGTPMSSIQQFNSSNDLHPYGSVVLPLYLSQKFGQGIIKAIWLRSGQLGPGPYFLYAADLAVDSLSNHTMRWPQAFSEFALWNYFTGARSGEAPPNVGYTERSNYPIIPDSTQFTNGTNIFWRPEIQRVTWYPDTSFVGSSNPFQPDVNGAVYIRLTDVSSISDRFWAKGDSLKPDSLCVLKYVDSLFSAADPSKDSTELPINFIRSHCNAADTLCRIRSSCSDTVKVVHDSLISFAFNLLPASYYLNNWPWGLQIVYGYPSVSGDEALNDSVHVESFVVPPSPARGARIDMYNKSKFSTITLIFTPASADYRDYSVQNAVPLRDISFLIDEAKEFDSSLVDIPGAILTPYPNPAVVANMQGHDLRFRFQVPTGANSLPLTNAPAISLDIYNVAGERVRTVTDVRTTSLRQGTYEAGWDMKNASGNDVASGVYIAVARLYIGGSTTAPVAEKKVKVLVVR